MTGKIAIACQGGGSQTAFTAGVLKAFFGNELHLRRKIVSLTGTSGGAVCAGLAWFGLLKAAQGHPAPVQDRIAAFWGELAARLWPEVLLETSVAGYLRTIDKGLLPRFEISPSSDFSQWMFSTVSSMLPRAEYTDLKRLLEKDIEFAELPRLIEPDSPVLHVGAADVLTGELKIFNSREGEIRVEAILASAAVPSLFPAVQIGDHYYWDGLFSDNPPLKDDRKPPRGHGSADSG
jgi:NTE family protein